MNAHTLARVVEQSRKLEARNAARDLSGDLILPNDPRYDDARQVWNGMIDRRPGLIARCARPSDVQRAVRFARRHALKLTVRGGGHNIGGRAVADDAVMIDLSGQRQVTVDPETRFAHVAPGATLSDVDHATLPHGLVLPAGIMSETGVAGLTLGGGFGWLSRRFGLTCDHLIEAEVVTGQGELVTVSDEHHADLMWLLRGGGGGGGVVVGFRFALRSFQPTVIAGPLVRSGDQLALSFDRFRASAAESPDELGSMLKLGAAPPAPFIPAPFHGKPVAFTIVCHTGVPDRIGDDLQPLRQDPQPIADLIQPRPFAQFQAMFDAGEPRGRRNYWKSEYVLELDDALRDILIDASARLPSPAANIKVFRLGGAVSRTPAPSSAAGHRDAQFIIVVASAWTAPSDDESNISWVRETWARVHARSGRGGYINFMTDDIGPAERNLSHAGVDIARLAQVARRYDPDGLLDPL